jgi:hypothetical protein
MGVLTLLVRVTLGCVAASTVTVSLGPAYAGAGDRDYESLWTEAR